MKNNDNKNLTANQTNIEASQRSEKRLYLILGLAFGAIILAGLIVGLLQELDRRSKVSQAHNHNFSFSQDDKNRQEFKDERLNITELADKVAPSVVSITTMTNVETFWGKSASQRSAGTGVILSKDGYILTNKHVVNGANKIAIVSADNQIYENVKLVFIDPLNDLAFLKVSTANQFKAIEIGDSKTIRVGQPVLAIGNALGEYQNTVTNGIISGIGRSIVARGSSGEAESLSDLIQTNAAINSGNSGGPLINAGGQLIGINTAIAQGANGIGFAIPIGAAKGIIKQLGNKDEQIKRGFVGVRYSELTPGLIKKYHIKNATKGALVLPESGVLSASPADKAGVKPGDVIVKVNQQAVGVAAGLSTLGAEFAPGEEMSLELLRDGQLINLKLKIGVYSE